MEYKTFEEIVKRIRREKFQMDDIVSPGFDTDVIGQVYVFARIEKLGEEDIETAKSYAHAVLVSFYHGFHEGQRRTLEHRVEPDERMRDKLRREALDR